MRQCRLPENWVSTAALFLCLMLLFLHGCGPPEDHSVSEERTALRQQDTASKRQAVSSSVEEQTGQGADAVSGSTARGAKTDATVSSGGSTAARDSGKWVGTVYPPLPPNVRSQGGTVIRGPSRPSRFSIDDIVSAGERMLWLSHRVRPGQRRNGNTSSKRVVKDELTVPAISDSLEVFYPPLCGHLKLDTLRTGALTPSDIEFDPEILAVVRPSDSSQVRQVKRAWRVDRSRARFVPIRSDRIVCFSETGPSYMD